MRFCRHSSSDTMRQEVANDRLGEDRITLKPNSTAGKNPRHCGQISLPGVGSASCQIMNSNTTTAATTRQSIKHTNSATQSTCANVDRSRISGNRSKKSSIEWSCIMRNNFQTTGAGQSNAKAPDNFIIKRFAKRSRASYTSEGLSRPCKFVCLVALLALTSSGLYAAQAADSPAPSSEGAELAKGPHGNGAIKQHHQPDERSDSSSSSKLSEQAPSKSASEKSIVASLSSAVATAAAAAAVAAAQSSLSSNDARSLASSSHHRQHSQTPARSPGLNLAIKLVDTIPEVPYSILHNMKKLDHAAPFYNVPNKLSGSNTKESSQNFLSSALAAGSFGGAAEQLSALFRSPLWKRISDSYGEFTSEFRSRFRAPGAQPMKGPTGSTTKLLRDISVPALLMLLASSVSGADWRPVRTRRKSFAPVNIPIAALPPSLASNPAFITSLAQYYQNEQPSKQAANMEPLIGESSSTSNEWVDRSAPAAAAGRLPYGQQAAALSQQPAELNQISGANDIHLRPTAMDGSGTNTWVSPPHLGATVLGQPLSNGGQEQNQQYQEQPLASFHERQPQQQQLQSFMQQQQQQAVRRSDEILTPAGGHSNGRDAKPLLAGGQARGNLFSSLTSDLGRGGLMSKIFNANAGADGSSYRMMSIADGLSKLSPMKRDQLSDKHRYSLVESSGGPESMLSAPTWEGGGANEQKLSAAAKPLLLSAMAHALTSMINAPPTWSSAESGSSAAAQQSAGQPFGKSGLLSRANFQHLMGDKTINQEETFARRQPQQRSGGGGAPEQRDLTKLLPESWREVVKRTMSTVKQEANVQWKSIEGQLTNWVQDKLKTVAAGASGSPSTGAGASSSGAGGSGGAGSSASQAPMAGMLASMSSTALNILGLHKNTNSSTHSHSPSDHNHHHHQQTSSVAKAEPSSSSSLSGGGDHETSGSNQRGKLEKKTGQQPAVGALAGVANVIVKSLTNRQSSTQSSPSLSPSTKSPASSATTNDAAPSQANPQSSAHSPDDGSTSAAGSVASKYPTLTGPPAS